MPHSSRHLAIWTRIPATRRKICLTVQIHHRARLAPFKVLISRILRSASNLGRRGVCKNIVNVHTLLANQSGICFFCCCCRSSHKLLPHCDKTDFEATSAALNWCSTGLRQKNGNRHTTKLKNGWCTIVFEFCRKLLNHFYLFTEF